MINTSNIYLIYHDGNFSSAEAQPYNGMLFDTRDGLPVIERDALQQNVRASEVLAAFDLLARAKVSDQVDRARILARSVMKNRPLEIDRHVWERKQKFIEISRALHDRDVRACIVPAPTHDHALVKTIERQQVFSRMDARWMLAHSVELTRIGGGLVIKALEQWMERDESLPFRLSRSTAARETVGPAVELSEGSPFLSALAEFGIAGEVLSSLQRWGGSDRPFINFLNRRAAWSGRGFIREAAFVAAAGFGENPPAFHALWLKMLARQTAEPYQESGDLLAHASRWRETELWCAERNIRISNLNYKQLASKLAPELLGPRVVRGSDPDYNRLADLAVEFRITDDEYCLAKRTLAKATGHSSIPLIELDGEDFGLSGLSLRTLRKDDPLNLFAGAYMGVCTHIGNETALPIASMTSPDVATVVVADRKTPDELLAKMIVYVGVDEDGYRHLVINSWENSKGRDAVRVETNNMAVLDAYAGAVLKRAPDFRHVYVGSGIFYLCGRHEFDRYARVLKPARPNKRMLREETYDSQNQYQIA